MRLIWRRFLKLRLVTSYGKRCPGVMASPCLPAPRVPTVSDCCGRGFWCGGNVIRRPCLRVDCASCTKLSKLALTVIPWFRSHTSVGFERFCCVDRSSCSNSPESHVYTYPFPTSCTYSVTWHLSCGIVSKHKSSCCGSESTVKLALDVVVRRTSDPAAASITVTVYTNFPQSKCECFKEISFTIMQYIARGDVGVDLHLQA